ncbi:MAG: hypothetical protein JWQ72_2308 [Polaromonas sp.]|nr:hypothetical protein [Polaromonas sp.]
MPADWTPPIGRVAGAAPRSKVRWVRRDGHKEGAKLRLQASVAAIHIVRFHIVINIDVERSILKCFNSSKPQVADEMTVPHFGAWPDSRRTKTYDCWPALPSARRFLLYSAKMLATGWEHGK